jgi:electron transfer flavoprotein alpha subunit
MSVLIFADQSEGHIRKSTYEALSYGAKVAELTGTVAEAIVLGPVLDNLSGLGKYGITKVHHVPDNGLEHMDARCYTAVIAEAVQQTGADTVIFSNNITGKAVAPRLSARLKAGLVAGAVSLPDLAGGFSVRRSVFSGKAYANVSIITPIRIITLNQNAYGIAESAGTAEVLNMTISSPASRLTFKSTSKVSGKVPLTEAEMVISGGRGLKGPEHWGLVEDLADLLGAATACSRAVADAHWRPHHEHVGQTGLAIAPNLYFAIGISGAIQHLAGVNRSKVIVVVNKDPEAPFFKAADYGIVGDAFEVMPKVIEAVRRLKAN